MKYAVLSDVHANIVALDAALADVAALGIDRVVCLGDVVGYGPAPAETLERIRTCSAAVIAGNHDAAVSGAISAEDFIDLAGDAVVRHREALSAEQMDWLKKLPLTTVFGGAAASHGDFISPIDFNYIDDEASAKVNFRMRNEQLLFVGHTHVPCIFLTGSSGSVYRLEPQDFILEDGKRYIVNPGSVGYPRENGGQCYSTYVIYDDVERSVRYRTLPFSVASVMQRGVNPSRKRRRVIISAALAVAAVAVAAAGWLAMRGPEEKVVTKVVEVDKAMSRAFLLVEKSVVLKPGMTKVKANFCLEKDSDPAELRIVFETMDGKESGRESEKVKRDRMKKTWLIPSGAAVAKFTVLKYGENDKVSIKAFRPEGL